MNKILTECGSCGGTGLYQGMCEKPGEPVICLTCSGTGAREIHYTPFTGRHVKRGIKVVRYSRGTFIGTGVGGVPGSEMTYADFLKNIKPPVV